MLYDAARCGTSRVQIDTECASLLVSYLHASCSYMYLHLVVVYIQRRSASELLEHTPRESVGGDSGRDIDGGGCGRSCDDPVDDISSPGTSADTDIGRAVDAAVESDAKRTVRQFVERRYTVFWLYHLCSFVSNMYICAYCYAVVSTCRGASLPPTCCHPRIVLDSGNMRGSWVQSCGEMFMPA